MVIAIGNAKGGTGKSTLLLLLASYLSKKTQKVFLISMEEKGTLSLLFERSKILEHELPWEYFTCDLSRATLLISRLAQEKGAIILLEFPSQLYDENMVHLFAASDLLICPFCYDSPTLNASIYFACLARRIKKDIPLLFLPNRVISNPGYEFREETDQVLRQIAPVSPCIFEHIGFQRISSMSLDRALLKRCAALLDLIYSQYLPLNADTSIHKP